MRLGDARCDGADSDRGLPIARLKDRDVYAPVTGFVDGFPVGADPAAHRAWIAHCYGTVGAGRGDTIDSGNGAELYVVIGQAPRGLDLNIAPVGRVLQGMELLSSLPRGGGPLGFYLDEEKPKRVLIRTARLASELPESARTAIEVLRTDTPLFTRYVEARRNRSEPWFVRPAGHIDVCNLPTPVRDAK